MSTEIVGFGEQVTLPATILTPSASWASIVNLNNHINGLKNDVGRRDNNDLLKRTTEGTQFGAQWIMFVREWTAWYLSIPHGGHGTVAGVWRTITFSEVAQLRVFAGRFNTFDQRAEALGINVTPVGNPQGDEPFSVPTIVWAGLGVIALGAVAFMSYSASKFAPAANVMAERFRTNRESTPMMAGLRGKRSRRRH